MTALIIFNLFSFNLLRNLCLTLSQTRHKTEKLHSLPMNINNIGGVTFDNTMHFCKLEANPRSNAYSKADPPPFPIFPKPVADKPPLDPFADRWS